MTYTERSGIINKVKGRKRDFMNQKDIDVNMHYGTLFGIQTKGTIVDGLEEKASPYEQYLFQIWKGKEGYSFFVETFIGFPDKNGCINYMKSILEEVKKWMEKHNFDANKELNVYEVFSQGVNANTAMETIEDCYALLKLLVRGFGGQGIL